MRRTRWRRRRRISRLAVGLAGVENSLALLLNQVHRGACTLEQVVAWMCDAPARVWDLVGKGRIARGYDADLVLVDLTKRATVRDAEQETKRGGARGRGGTGGLAGADLGAWRRGFREGRIDASVRGPRFSSTIPRRILVLASRPGVGA